MLRFEAANKYGECWFCELNKQLLGARYPCLPEDCEPSEYDLYCCSDCADEYYYRWDSIEDLQTRYSKEISEFILRKMKKSLDAMTIDSCNDNFRVCEIGNKREEGVYEKQKRRGCCGSFDSIVKYHGRKFRVGFNYGH